MKILIVSDTHRRNENYLEVVKNEQPFDMVVHCGDVEGSEYLIEEVAGCPVQMVLGNNDFFSDLPREIEFEIGDKRAMVTHGHNYYVNMGYEMLRDEALDRECSYVFFGHTHKPVIEIGDEITVVNPGSLSYPRQENRRPSYVVMTVDEEENATFELKFL